MPHDSRSDHSTCPGHQKILQRWEQAIQVTRPTPQSGHNLQVTGLEQRTAVSPGKPRGPISSAFYSPILSPGHSGTQPSHLLEAKIQCNARDPSSYFFQKVNFSKTREDDVKLRLCWHPPPLPVTVMSSDTLQGPLSTLHLVKVGKNGL